MKTVRTTLTALAAATLLAACGAQAGGTTVRSDPASSPAATEQRRLPFSADAIEHWSEPEVPANDDPPGSDSSDAQEVPARPAQGPLPH
jgi:hypothetical protein